VRTAIQALAAVLGGTNSLHTNSYDEALALPTEAAATIALRTQQIIARESGVINTVDPLGGSYFVESLTNRMEESVLEYFDRIDQMGGMISAIEAGFPQREILDASYRYQRALEQNEKTVVGVNEFVHDEQAPLATLKIGDEAAKHQVAGLQELRSRRDNSRVQGALEALQAGARTSQNLMPLILEAVREYATLGEMCATLKRVFGIYTEPSF
jgi:methylmalonyl-CoA mutase N-terminal domain/subunit